MTVSTALLAGVIVVVLKYFPEQILGRPDKVISPGNVATYVEFDEQHNGLSVRLPEHLVWFFDTFPEAASYQILDGRAQVVAASRGAGRMKWPRINGLITRTESSVTDRQGTFKVVTLRLPRGATSFFIQTSIDEKLVDIIASEEIEPIRRVAKGILFLFFATIVFGLAMTLTVRRVLKPLRNASSEAALITPRNITARLSTVDIPLEIKPLIKAFNETLDRLENGYIVQHRFISSAAHELQTPLTLIRGRIELHPDIDDKEQLISEIDLMARQVRQLLHLAEVSEEQNFSFRDVKVSSAVQDVTDYLGRKANSMHVKLEVSEFSPAKHVIADEGAFFVLLKNLIENAINVSPPSSTVHVLVVSDAIHVQDQGPGINPDYFPFLFERFWRAPGTIHEGAGLGLAICSEIVRAHGWSISVKNQSSGARFTVFFADNGLRED
ncbi:sensor histidine kinase [Burkholderia sp. BCC1993]|uniref:sensor histidine kinase n=1 Tax=Burkholderia sp. BCC1993 TaxID=2817444 RepID=UPI002AB0F58E|nr:ATP-binding protein [Burkholderia sp. BCC1993]